MNLRNLKFALCFLLSAPTFLHAAEIKAARTGLRNCFKGERLLRGSQFCEVCEATYLGDKGYVVKTVNLPGKSEKYESLLKEIRILKALRKSPQPFLLAAHKVWIPPLLGFQVSISMLAKESDLGSLVLGQETKGGSAKPQIPADMARRFLYQTLVALNTLHAAGVSHGDLKLENAFISEGNVYLGDFGIAGTLTYLPPEVLIKLRNPSSATQIDPNALDIWSAGVMAVAMLAGRRPFAPSTCEGLLHQMAKFDLSKFLPAADPYAIDLLSQLMTKEADKRFSAKQALKHPYFEGLHDPEKQADASEPLSVKLDDFAGKGLSVAELRALIEAESDEL